MGLIFKKGSAQPNFTVAAAITGTLEATQELTCSWTVVRAKASNVTCRWYRHTADDGSDPSGVLLGTGTTYTLTGTDVGNYIRAIVTAINPAGTVTSTTSYTAIITSGDPPTPPTIMAAAVITGTPEVLQTLTVTATFAGATSVTYQWYSYTTEPTGSPLAGNDEVELGTADTQPLTASEADRWIVAVVMATNAAGSAVTSAKVPMAGVDSYAPIAPAQYTVPAYDISGLTQVQCNAGDDLQAKLNNLRPGQVLVLEAGATWTGNYTVPATYLDGSDWAYIISSQMANLPAEGERVSVADADNMPKVQYGTKLLPGTTWNTVTNISKSDTLLTLTHASLGQSVLIPVGGSAELRNANEPEYNSDFIVASRTQSSITVVVPAEWSAPTGAVQFAHIVSFGNDGDPGVIKILGGVNKLRIAGLNITTQYRYRNTLEYALVTVGSFGTSSGEEIVIDRCLVHGTTTGNNRDGIVMGGRARKIAVVGCDIDYLKCAPGESHGIHIFLTPGPTLIHNNRICACAINVFICDNSNPAGTTRSPLPADITVTKNLIEKRSEWDPNDVSKDGIGWQQKNLFECKGAKRVLIRGNVFKNSWIGDQIGQGYFHQNEGGDGVWDIDIRDNIYYSFATAFQMSNPFDYNRGFGWQRVRLQNNLFALPRVASETILLGGVGSGFGRYLSVKHNTYVTAIEPKSMWFFNNTSNLGPSGIEHVVVEDNIFRQGKNAIGLGGNNGISDGSTSGRPCALIHMTDFDFNKNISVGSSSGQYNVNYADWRNWASGSTSTLASGIWSNSNVGYVSTAFTELGHFALSGSSQFKNAATDGTDIGADISAIAAQINASDNPFGA